MAYQGSSEENLQLQHSIQNQHTMLQESTLRIAQLEESQSQLQTEVHIRVPMALENQEISVNKILVLLLGLKKVMSKIINGLMNCLDYYFVL